jgi:hypothetical protein
MANDESRSEIFIREVDEELRRDQLIGIWKRFAPLIVAVCVLVVLITAGYRGWLWWSERQASHAGDQYLAAVEQLSGADKDAGKAALKTIVDEGGGYATLARLRLAGEDEAAGDQKAALAGFDAVTNDKSASGPLRDVARTRAALVALDMGDLDGAKSRATPLDVAGNPWRAFAREVLGTVAYKAGDMKTARGYFSDMQQDAQTPPDLWIRAGLMVALIDGQMAEPKAEAAADGAKAPEAASDGAAAPAGDAAPGGAAAPEAGAQPAPEPAEPPSNPNP